MAGIGRLELGLCCGPDACEEAMAAGFDYVELPAWMLAGGADYSGMPVGATNLFFSGPLSLWKDPEACRAHARLVIGRAVEQGIKLMVIGSGGVRRALDGEDSAPRESEFCDFVAEMQAEFPAVTLAPESLNRDETNVGNDYNPLAQALKERGCGVTLDAFHSAKEPGFAGWDGFIQVLPNHLHISSRKRDMPDRDDEFLLELFRNLAEMGYQGRASYEGAWNLSLNECRENLAALAAKAGFLIS